MENTFERNKTKCRIRVNSPETEEECFKAIEMEGRRQIER